MRGRVRRKDGLVGVGVGRFWAVDFVFGIWVLDIGHLSYMMRIRYQLSFLSRIDVFLYCFI